MSEPLNFGIQYRDGSHRGPHPPNHCQTCRRPMRLYQTLGSVYSATPRFDSDGNPNIVRHVECSAPWLLRVLGIHDHATQDAFGDWPWIR